MADLGIDLPISAGDAAVAKVTQHSSDNGVRLRHATSQAESTPQVTAPSMKDVIGDILSKFTPGAAELRYGAARTDSAIKKQGG